MDGPRVSIVVVSSVNLAGLGRCLRSIAATAAPEVPSETIVVLNGAAYEADAMPAEHMAGVKVIESLANRGFAGGSNLGREAATGEFIVLLHDDAEAQEGWLTQLVHCADEQPEAGAVGARVLNPDGTLQLAGAVLWRDGTITALGPDQPGGYLERRPVDYTASCALLVRAKTWDAVGGLDDRLYPAYYIDVDLALSIRRFGQVVFYEPRARVVHHKGASTSARFKAFVGGRNAQLFRAKWERELQLQEERSEFLESALERTRREAARLAAARTQLTRRPRPKSLDSVATERKFLRLEREVMEEFIAKLLNELGVFEEAFDAKTAELAEARVELERLRQSALAATEPIGLSARLRRFIRAISRLATPSRKG